MPKAAKDPNKPKRGLSAFMFFSQATRPSVVEENPGIAFGDVGRIIGEKWRALTDEEKKPFEKQSAEDKKRYEREMKEYRPGSPGKAKKKKKEEEEEEVEEADAE